MMVTELVFQSRKLVTMIMDKLYVSQWKEFKVGDLLTKVETKKVPFKALDLPVNPTDNCYLPLVAAGIDNQGRSRYVDPKYATVLHGCLTVSANGANSGVTFYQDSDFSILQDAYALELVDKYKSMGMDNIYLFLAAVIRRGLINNDWSNKATWTRVQKTIIKLPVTSSGEPDWQYMDSYIAKLTARAYQEVSLLKCGEEKSEPLKISGWREYNIGQLFNIRPSKYIRGNGTAFSNRKLFDDGPNPVVVNSSVNNGLGGTTSYEPTEHGNVITYSDTVDGNTVFYQAKPFVGYSHVKVMEPKEKRDSAEMMFLTAVIGRRLSDGNYDYTNKMTTNRVLNTTIKLPALSDGTPDWATMRERVVDLVALSHRNVISLDPAELPIFVGYWHEFKIGQLFDIETGGDLVFRNLLEGEIPVVSHSMENNGVKGCYQRIEGRKRYDHEITLALADRGTFFASSQDKDFYVATRVKALIFKDRKHINENIRLFFCSVINRLALRFADYSENATNRLPGSVIKLPVDINGHLDWQYMNDYVEFMKSIADRHVGSFQSIINK